MAVVRIQQRRVLSRSMGWHKNLQRIVGNRRQRLWIVSFILFLLIGLGHGETSQAADRFARGKNGMVAAPTPEAAAAGLAVLQAGGNAVDAAAATAFALWVTDPAMCSVGGRAQILLRLANGEIVGIDGATQAPLAVRVPAETGYGYRTCPVPGAPAALAKMVQSHGTRSLAALLQPAIRLAENGFVVKEDYHQAFRQYGGRFKDFPGTARHFLKADCSFYSRGDTLRQPALAQTLRILAAEGVQALYRGRLAAKIAADMRSNGGLITAEDLSRYQALPGEIVRGHYCDWEIVSRGDQCDGASVIEMLQVLEQLDFAQYPPADPRYWHILAQTIYTVSLDEHLPDWQQVSPELAARRALEIDLNRALPVPVRTREDDSHTNHLCVVDRLGNAVAITQSIGPTFGSKVVHPELGFFYAYSYSMNDDPLPLRRDKTEQSPTLILQDGRPLLILGSAGGSRIPASIVQVIVQVLDHGATLEQALTFPRVFLRENELRLETAGLSPVVLSGLRALGYALREYPQLDGYFAKVHAIFWDWQSGSLIGGSDPRDFGAAGGF